MPDDQDGEWMMKLLPMMMMMAGGELPSCRHLH
jgi:hypothetical protein